MSYIGPEVHLSGAHVCNVASLKPLSGADWLLAGSLQKMVLVISSLASKEVLERWTFDIQTDKATMDEG